MMKRWMIVCVMLLVGAACGDETPQKADFTTKEQARFNQPQSAQDLCDEFNYYGDGECDDWCPTPDPDCGGVTPDPEPDPDPEPRPDPDPRPPGEPDPDPDPEPLPIMCPDPEAPNVDYISQDPDQCAVIDFGCPEGWDYITDPDCGCGCIQPTCEDSGDCSVGQRCAENGICRGSECLPVCVDTTCGLPGTAVCLAIPNCVEGTFPAEVNGCFTCVEADSCIDRNSMCSGNADCPDGYCDRQIFQCVYPNCDDARPTVCDAERPDCGVGLIGAARDGCWECVNPQTCMPPEIGG